MLNADACGMQIMRAVGDTGQRLELPRPSETESAAGEAAIVTGLTDLISRCWAAEPTERPSMPTIIGELRGLLDICRASNRSSASPQSVAEREGHCLAPVAAGQQPEPEPEPEAEPPSAAVVRPPPCWNCGIPRHFPVRCRVHSSARNC